MKKKEIGQLFLVVWLLFSGLGCQKEKTSQRLNEGAGESFQAIEIPADQKKAIDEIQGNLKKIEKAVNEIVVKTSNQRQLYIRLGDRYRELGWLKEAYKAYSKAIEIKPEDEVAHYKAAVCAAAFTKRTLPLEDKEIDFEKAVAHYKKAIEIRPDYKEALSALALLYHFELKQSVEAMELVLKGIGQDNRPTPQLFLLRTNIALYFEKYKKTNGVDYPQSKALLARCNQSSWAEVARGDLQLVVDRFNGVKDPEIQQMVATALRMKGHTVEEGTK